MFNDDFFEEDFHDLDDLLNKFNKIKKGEPHGLVSEDDFEFLLDFFESNNDTENIQFAYEVCTTLYPFSSSLLIRKAEWLTNHKKFGQALKVLDSLDIKDIQQTPITSEGCFAYGLSISWRKNEIARIGLLKPTLVKQLDIKQEVFYAEIEWDYLMKKYIIKVPKK